MEFYQNPARAVFARQPARILLVDFSPPFSSGLCQSICEGLENLFTFVCNLTGPCRVPYFGLFALGSYSENLFPLQYVPGNYPRIKNALEELRAFGRDGFLMNQQKTFLLQAVKEAILQFKKQSQTLRQTTGFAAQLEVVLMTCQTSISSTAKQIEEAVSESLDTENLRRIQLVSLAHEGPVISIPQGLSPSPKQPASQHCSLSSDGVWDSGIVELISLATDNLSMENFFRGWLLDSGTDKECLYITFPSEGGKEDFKLTCDLQEPFIDPFYLPGVQGEFALNLISTSNQKQMSTGMQMKPAATITVPVHTLRVIKLVQMSGICESVLFGVPLILKPTACWKLPWDELERNQQLFQGMCRLLHEKELAILAKKDTLPPPSYSKVGGGVYLKPSSSRPTTASTSAGHFIILPSHGMSMLIKSVAVKELMLPTDAHEKGEPPLSDTLETVQKVLEKIETVDVFNPLLVSSGLHSNLKKMLSKGAVRRTAKAQRNQQMSRPQPLSRGTRGQITRGQSARGQSSRGQRSRGRGAGPSVMVQQKDYSSPAVNRFEKFFPDFED